MIFSFLLLTHDQALLSLIQYLVRGFRELWREGTVLCQLLLPIKRLFLPLFFVEQAISVELNEAGTLALCLLRRLNFIVLTRTCLEVRAEEGL